VRIRQYQNGKKWRKNTVSGNGGYSLKMRQLGKPEYRLMKALLERYQLRDSAELFSVALSLMYEVSLYKHGEGEKWIAQVIDTLSSTPESHRTYDTHTPLEN